MQRFIRVRCPHCDARIKAPIQLSGQSRTCPGCTLRFVVQRTAPEDAGPILLFDHLSNASQPTAREEAKRLLGQVVGGADPATEKKVTRKAKTVAELCDLYLGDAEAGRLLTRRKETKKRSRRSEGERP